MALSRSLSIGASSMVTHQKNFDIISNNLANANTVGFKSNQATFQEELNQITRRGQAPDTIATRSAFGGVNPVQFGNGVKLGSIQQNFSQGTVETTTRSLDLALNGKGFFVFEKNGQELYTRAGNLTFDRDGNLVDSATGSYMQGYNVESTANGTPTKDSKGEYKLAGKIDNIQVNPEIISLPKQTQNVTIYGNLDALNKVGETKTISVDIYDQIGHSHEMTLTFTKEEGERKYKMNATINDIAVELNGLATKTLEFNKDGTLKQPLTLGLFVEDINNAVGNAMFSDLNPGNNNDILITLANPDNLLSGITNLAGANNVSFTDQDGWASGNLVDIAFDQDGTIRGAFSNGRSEKLGQVIIAQFTNEAGLLREGSNFYSESPNSGLASVGIATETFPETTLYGFSLEQSNVDMTTEFTELISTQRAYEAAARVITVSDTMLGEATILKR